MNGRTLLLYMMLSAAIGVEDARIEKMVEMSMHQYRHLSEDLSKDRM